MRLLTRAVRAAEAADQWMKLYPLDERGVGAELKLLGDNPDPNQVDSIIGNGTWTEIPACDECGALDCDAVEVGEEFGVYSNTAVLCKNCVENAIQLFK